MSEPVRDTLRIRRLPKTNRITRDRLMKTVSALIPIVFAILQTQIAEAKLDYVAAGGFTIKHTFEINKPASEAFNVFAMQIGAWWDSNHTYSGKSENLSIDLRPNGCFCEKLGPQSNIVHM